MIPPSLPTKPSINLSFARQRTPGHKGGEMSRQLPPQSNLEYLKKQAKELLRDMRQRDPAGKLADAQRAIAREYGFSSWPKLKAHVESPPPHGAMAAALVAEPSQGAEGGGVAPAGGPLPIASLTGAEPEKKNPFIGAWKANMSKSRRHPDSPFHSATLHVEVIGDLVAITDIVVDGSGREERRQNTLCADGKEHPSEYGGYLLVARWIGSHALEAAVKKDGQVEGRVTYEVSADSATLTILTDDQLFVCDRQ